MVGKVGLPAFQMTHTVVMYHASYTDGFGAAWAAWHRLRDQGEYLPMNYGDDVPDLGPSSHVYLLDFSLSRERMLQLHDRHGAANVTLLDHHQTAAENLNGVPNCHIDQSKSGAVLAWEHFCPNETVPNILLYVQDRDLWRWELPDSRAVSAYLNSYKFDFARWNRLARDLETDKQSVVRAGEAILRNEQEIVTRVCQRSMMGTISDCWIPIVNSAVLQSELGERMLTDHPEAPFAASYFDVSATRRVWSLRGRAGGQDVSEVASFFGGGGHRTSAGFTQEIAPVWDTLV